MARNLRFQGALVASVALVASLFAAPAQAAPAPVTSAAAAVSLPTSISKQTQMSYFASHDMVTTTASKSIVSVTITQGKRQWVQLQRKSGKKWKTVAKKRTVKSSKKKELKFRVPKKAGTASYRVVMPKTKSNWKQTTSTFKIFQSNSKKYKAKTAAARKTIKPYCSKTPIIFNGPTLKAWGLTKAGLVGMSQEVTLFGKNTSWIQSIELKSKLKGKKLKHTAAYGCAQIVMSRTIVKGKSYSDKYGQTALAPFPGDDPFKKANALADCMANEITKTTGQTTYIKSCDDKQRAVAKKTLRDFGKKYQSPSLTFKTRR